MICEHDEIIENIENIENIEIKKHDVLDFKPDLIYISLLIIPCIIYYVTNKETLNLLHVCFCVISCANV